MALEDVTVPRRDPAPTPVRPSEQQRLPVLTAVRRHWMLALLPVIVLVGAAVAYGLTRDPEYEAEARLNVGGLNLTQQSIEGYTAAVQQLAIAYSRAIHATSVVEQASETTGIPPAEVHSRLGATPIENSSVIRVITTGSDGEETRELADASADALVTYAITLNSGRSTSQVLFRRFTKASREERRLIQKRDATKSPTRVRQLETQIDSAKLDKDTAAFLYGQSQAGQAMTELVQKLAPAGPAESDREQVTREYAAGAAIAGLLIGIGLAVMRANSRARRRLHG